MTYRRPHLHTLALILALGATLFRGLVPAGFMVDFSGTSGAPLVLCSGGMLKTAPARAGDPLQPAATLIQDCGFAVSAAPALPPAPLGLAPLMLGDASPRVASAIDSPIVSQDRRPPARAPPYTA